MRRYGVARYLTEEQRQRAATATYTLVDVGNGCERGDCWHLGEYVQAARHVEEDAWGRTSYACPIGVALGRRDAPDPWEAEALISSGVSQRTNARRLSALSRFMHDVDSGKIGPDEVAEALGVTP